MDELKNAQQASATIPQHSEVNPKPNAGKYWPPKPAEVRIHVAAIALICLVFLAGQLVPAKQQMLMYISGFGLLSLLSIIFVLAIPLLARHTRHPIFMAALANLRWIGIWTFFFAAMHVFLVLNFLLGWNLDMLISNPGFLTLGAIAFLMLIAMAATSNDFSVKTLGPNWKTLQRLVYVALLLVLAHFFGVGKIFAKNPFVLYGAIFLAAIVLVLKFKPK
jgi:methionine sulfoxide reductase heme-binding subunit